MQHCRPGTSQACGGGPDQDTIGGSTGWCERLPYGSLAGRLKAAKKILRGAGPPSDALFDLLQSMAGMTPVSEQNSPIRQLEDDCDDVEDTRRGLDDLIHFILAPQEFFSSSLDGSTVTECP